MILAQTLARVAHDQGASVIHINFPDRRLHYCFMDRNDLNIGLYSGLWLIRMIVLAVGFVLFTRGGVAVRAQRHAERRTFGAR